MIPRNASPEEKTKIFIEKANLIHNNEYSYDKVVYHKTKEKVIITCKIHGDFLQTPNQHLNGYGCPKCSYKKSQKHNDRLNKITREKFKDDMKRIFSDKYDFSEFEYKLDSIKGKIICPKHGEFFKTPRHLKRGQGCPLCSKEEKGSKGERIISSILKENGIIFEQEYKINQIEYLRNKPFDFFIPSMKLLIEFHGEQHYKRKFYMSDDDLAERKEIDNKKKEMSEELGYKLCVIKYNDNVKEKILDLIGSTTRETTIYL